MKFFFLAFTALCCFCTTYAQIAYTPGSNTFSLSPTVPVIGSNNPLLPNAVNNIPGSIGTTPSCAFVLEYGDGYFSSNISSSHTYKTAGSRMAVLSLSGRYDTIKPPRAFAAHINDLANYNGSPTQSILNTNEFVRLTPIANNINVRDEMLFILTYKIPQHTDGGKLMLFYNESNFNVFESIAGPSSVITESTDDANVSGSVKRIRTYFTESPAIAGLPMGTVDRKSVV